MPGPSPLRLGWPALAAVGAPALTALGLVTAVALLAGVLLFPTRDRPDLKEAAGGICAVRYDLVASSWFHVLEPIRSSAVPDGQTRTWLALSAPALPQSASADAFTRVSALLQKARIDKAKALLAEVERRAPGFPPTTGPLDPQQRDYWTFLADLYRSLGRTKELDQLLAGRSAAAHAP